MSTTATSAGTRSGLILLLVSLFLGLGIAFAAAATIVATQGPADSSAVSEGPGTAVPAGELLNYGG